MATVAMGFAELPLEKVAAEKRKEGLGLRIFPLLKRGQRERKAHRGKRDSIKRGGKAPGACVGMETQGCGAFPRENNQSTEEKSQLDRDGGPTTRSS